MASLRQLLTVQTTVFKGKGNHLEQLTVTDRWNALYSVAVTDRWNALKIEVMSGQAGSMYLSKILELTIEENCLEDHWSTMEVQAESIQKNLMWSAFLGGGAAGLFVDVVLFPLDTLKTRLQAEQGFKNAGGFRGIYKGLGPQVVGSAPQAALFFLTYESIKHYAEPRVPKEAMPLVYMFGASVAEVMACLVRVPMEVAKQRKQTSVGYKSSVKILMAAYKYEGFFKGVYRGFGSTIMREIPFSIIQFPTLEFFKSFYRTKFKNNMHLDSWEVAVCGSFAGGISAAITTPLDVVKTRIMLADRKVAKSGSLTFSNTFKKILKKEGVKGLFAGVVPRTLWIFLGGYIFFGTYDYAKNNVYEFLEERNQPVR